MAQTPLSSAAGYCTPLGVLTLFSRSIVADFLKETPNAPRPSFLAMLDASNPAGARLLTFIKRAAGEIESYCLLGKRYYPVDLAALSGVSAEFLTGINAARAVWFGFQASRPGSADPKDCPGAIETIAVLEALGKGERIFGLDETAEAGLWKTGTPAPGLLATSRVVLEASRFFGIRCN